MEHSCLQTNKQNLFFVSDDDYSALIPRGMFTASDSNTTKCVFINTQEDTVIEPTETFNVNIVTDGDSVTGDSTTIVIVDNDGMKARIRGMSVNYYISVSLTTCN